VQLVWHIQAGSKSAAFKEEFRIKRLQKGEKELLAASQPHTEGNSPRAQMTNHESEARLPGATLKTHIHKGIRQVISFVENIDHCAGQSGSSAIIAGPFWFQLSQAHANLFATTTNTYNM
jgi:hypothetical protein